MTTEQISEILSKAITEIQLNRFSGEISDSQADYALTCVNDIIDRVTSAIFPIEE